MRARSKIAPPVDDDGLLQQARRLAEAVREFRLSREAGQGRALTLAREQQRRVAISLLSELNGVLAALRQRRDEIGRRAGSVRQQIDAASAYSRTCGLVPWCGPSGR